MTQYLGCQLIRDRNNFNCRTSDSESQFVQTAYTQRLLRTQAFSMWDDVHPVATGTPMEPGTSECESADCADTPNPTLQRIYGSIVDSIGYLVQMTRCDLAFV